MADDAQLEHLQNRLARGIYSPSNACKIFFPKPSGILRPYTLLCIEDQVVYQAMANVVAEKLYPHARHRYNSEVFGHLYTGAGSSWFYRKWTEGYKLFNESSRLAFKNGYRWTASFDLAAFYDSIDYHVLRRMLGNVGLDHDFCKTLTDFLETWTATSTQIYHNHGIPQGPLSSGLIAEVVLKYFDDRHQTGHDVKYLRYVDDIRLFAKKEAHLRKSLVTLDRLSKDVGLFPQSGKIDLHEVHDIEKELKSISNPIEPAVTWPLPDQKLLRKRIAELAPGRQGYRVQDVTRFKYLVAHASASSVVVDRLWKVYERAPHFYPQVAKQLSKFKVLPDRHARRLLKEIEQQDLYPAIRAAFVQASLGKITGPANVIARKNFKALWKPGQNQPDFTSALWEWLHFEKHFTDAQVRYALAKTESVWLRAKLHYGLPWGDLLKVQRDALLNQSLRAKSADVAISAAWICALLGGKVERPIRPIHPNAKIVLKEMGVIRRAGTAVCGIRLGIAEITGADIGVGWKRLFGKNYKEAEALLVTCKGYFRTNPTAWVNATDGFVDWLLFALYRADPTLGTYALGTVGSVMHSVKLKTAYPAVSALLNEIHKKRYSSHLSHAVVKTTKKATGPVPYRWLRIGARLLATAARELRTRGF
ncbi:MAG: RNA-directed DNA polymerase [Ramlibacter sp.]|nr:RNA-directed DNA polymerase [Ramlibacter sp.]